MVARTGVAVTKSGVPVAIADALKAETEDLKNRIAAPGGDKIKLTKDKHFKLPTGEKHPGPLTVVVLDFVNRNVFHDRPFSEGEVTAPACFAIGTDVHDKLSPSSNSPDKQSDTCAKCPNNEFGSKGKGKACKNTRLLAVVAGEGEMAADPKAPMWLIEVSPTAGKAWDSYVATVRTQYNLPPVGVVTDVFFDPSSEFQSLRFGNPQPNPNLAMHYGRKPAAKERLFAEPDVTKYEAPKKPVKKK